MYCIIHPEKLFGVQRAGGHIQSPLDLPVIYCVLLDKTPYAHRKLNGYLKSMIKK